MILDTSAILAVLQDEAEAEMVAMAMDTALSRSISTGTLLELFVVVERKASPALGDRLVSFLIELDATPVAFTESQAHIARAAYRQYGRGSGHPARLNFGDCFSYALARERNEPLLFVGDDFIHTDIVPALPPANPEARDDE